MLAAGSSTRSRLIKEEGAVQGAAPRQALEQQPRQAAPKRSLEDCGAPQEGCGAAGRERSEPGVCTSAPKRRRWLAPFAPLTWLATVLLRPSRKLAGSEAPVPSPRGLSSVPPPAAPAAPAPTVPAVGPEELGLEALGEMLLQRREAAEAAMG